MKELKEINKKTTITLIFIILVLSVLLVLSLTGEINLQTKEETKSTQTTNNETFEKQYTYDEIAGLYEYLEEVIIDDEKLTEKFDLLLNNDGTYYYSDSLRVSLRYAGNYIIEDNTITLNQLFSIVEGPGTIPNFETIKIKINKDNNITYNAKTQQKNNEYKDITLTKLDKAKKEEFLKTHTGATKEEILDNSFYINKKSNIK